MNFSPKFENSEKQTESEKSLNQWNEKIDLPDDCEEWQNSLNLSDDLENFPPSTIDDKELDLSKFEESKQVKRIVEYLNNLSDVKYENWVGLSLSERIGIIQRIELQVAKSGCRAPLMIEVLPMNSNDYGYMDWANRKIVLSEALVSSNKYDDYRQCIKTLIHEGRHAYQYSNIAIERTEPNDEKFLSWKINLATGYCSAKLFGLKRYYLQPLEVDARVFSESIVSKIRN